MNAAFDESDPSAKPRIPANGPDGARFAVPPVLTSLDFAIDEAEQSAQGVETNFRSTFTSLKTPLFRRGKDAHGNVPCAACHGAAHAIWPNRDPKANDNVTAMQLQGHTGNVLECNVCDTADAFLKKDDLDGGACPPGCWAGRTICIRLTILSGGMKRQVRSTVRPVGTTIMRCGLARRAKISAPPATATITKVRVCRKHPSPGSLSTRTARK